MLLARAPQRRTLALAVCALAVAATAACGSGSTPASPASSGGDSAKPGSPTSSPSATASKANSASVITIKDYKFQTPGSVPAGATVTVMNQDAMAHTVTASGKGGFDVTIKANATATFTAPSKAGSYPFVCSFHGNMHSVLTVA